MTVMQVAKWPSPIPSHAFECLERLRVVDEEARIDTRAHTICDRVIEETSPYFRIVDIMHGRCSQDRFPMLFNERRLDLGDTSCDL